MRTLLTLAAAAVVLAATGVAHGLRTDRWGMSQEVTEAARRLDAVPDRVGDWSGQPVEIDARQLQTAQVVGHLARRYTNERTGQSVLVLLVSGRPGAIGAHSPEVCYHGAGFRLATEQKARSIKLPAQSVEFSHAIASKGEPRPEHLSLWWAWSTDGAGWETPASPRARFWRSPNLYKIYFIRSQGDPKASDDVTGTLMEELLPQIKRTLAAP